MATGRSLNKYCRVYVDGYDLSGYARAVGELSCVFEEGEDAPLNVAIKGAWLGQGEISCGQISALFDNTVTIGIHARLSSAPAKRTILVAQGIRAAPADNDPAFCGQFLQSDYKAAPAANPVALTINLAKTHAVCSNRAYAQPWGVLIHALAAATAANTATGLDQGGATAKGGFMCYQVTTAAGTGDITATLKVQDAAVNLDGSFSDLLSTGVINCGSGGVAVPTSGIVALSATADVRQFIRWQIVLGTATSVTFALAFVRNYI